MLMDTLIISLGLAVLGLALGSFAGATVWRLRARQLVEDKAAGEKVDKKEHKRLAPLLEAGLTKDRSRCLSCDHKLAWYDLIPVFSWLSTKGNCRYCKKPIGWFEPLIEVGLAALLVGSYLLWPFPLESGLQIAQLAIWLLSCVLLVVLFAYDSKWFILPDRIVYSLVGLGLIMASLHLVAAPELLPAVVSLASAVAILSGLYLVLWLVSKGQWIGFGDVKLGLGLALLLSDWKLAFIALFAANFVGCLIVLPGLMAGKLTRASRVPFGPLLIVGTIIAALLGPVIIDWYTLSVLQF